MVKKQEKYYQYRKFIVDTQFISDVYELIF